MNDFEFKRKVFEELEKKSHMVLGTSNKDRVTARNVSTIFMNGKVYFQTDINFLKYKQILQNSNVALCELDIQVEGIAKILGHPLEEQNQEFLKAFSQKHQGSFEKYTFLPNEVVVEVTPRYIEMWSYENDRPYIYNLNLETGDFLRREYSMNHNMKLNETPFERMKNGTKNIEYRLNDEKRQLVRIGDTILFSKLPDLNEKILTEVIDIRNFNTFYDAFMKLQNESNSDVGEDIEQAVASIRQYYLQEDEEKYGTLAITIKVLKR